MVLVFKGLFSYGILYQFDFLLVIKLPVTWIRKRHVAVLLASLVAVASTRKERPTLDLLAK